jgi:hypothetical protein
MISNASGQFLGYAIQFPRALIHILRSGPGDSVCIEVLGDVAWIANDGRVIAEEDKSSITGNPLTDRSVDLWKTFSNWIRAINNRELDINKTKFLLYTNQAGRDGIINKFHGAKNEEEAKAAIDSAKTKLRDIKKEHAIWEYYDYVINKHETMMIKLLINFQLEIDDEGNYDEIENEIIRKEIPSNMVKYIAENLRGWLVKVVIEKIKAKEKAIIKWEEYHHQFIVTYDNLRQKKLYDFTKNYPPSDKDVENQVNIHPCYIKQLESIGESEEDVIEAVTDYLKADVNRNKWIENEIIDVEIAAEFENTLNRTWKNERRSVEITQKNLCDEERGQLLLVKCKEKSLLINNLYPPASTVAGTFHALANIPIIGWHPQWEDIFKKKGS